MTSAPSERPIAPGATGETEQFLTFWVATVEYGVALGRCREVVELAPLTHVPSAPACVAGVMNLRGAVVPVVDLALRCGLPATVPSPRTCIVLVDVGGESLIGLLVDSVSRILELGRGDVEPPPRFGTRIRAEYLQGMGKVERKFVQILDVDFMLSTDELLAARTAPEGDDATAPTTGD